MRLLVSLCALLLVVSACRNSKEFSRPTPEKLQLGVLTKDDILRDYGRPIAQRTNVVGAPATGTRGSDSGPVSGTFILLNYRYRNPADAFFAVPGTSEKFLAFEFFNERLYAYSFVSDVASDSSNFDETKVSHLENGRTKRDEAEALLGPPSGRAVFPAVGPDEEKLLYRYMTGGQTIEVKNLELIFDGNETLKDFSFVSRNLTQPGTFGQPGIVTIPVLPATRAP